MGVPGATSNSPPPDPQAVEGAPQDTQAQQAAGTVGESTATRAYELGREVAVSNIAPGGVKRVSVAVALNQDAIKGTKPADLKKFEDLVSAAVGANIDRGDTVAVVVRPFKAAEAEEIPFWETPWFAMIVRNAVALVSVLLVLFLVARPIVRALTRPKDRDEDDDEGDPGMPALPAASHPASAQAGPDREQLSAQIELAQRIAREQPDDALQALRRMLGDAQQSERAA
jgi:flagellar M-ring protein FliF